MIVEIQALEHNSRSKFVPLPLGKKANGFTSLKLDEMRKLLELDW